MTTLRQQLHRRLMIQLSDVPWMSAAWALGLLVEGAAWALGAVSWAPAWAFGLKILGLYALLGYMSFTFNRRPLAWVTGGLIGVGWEVANRFLLPAWWPLFPVQTWSFEGFAPILVAALWYAAVPALGDRIVDPRLLRGGLFRWLASHHPRYEHLRS